MPPERPCSRRTAAFRVAAPHRAPEAVSSRVPRARRARARYPARLADSRRRRFSSATAHARAAHTRAQCSIAPRVCHTRSTARRACRLCPHIATAHTLECKTRAAQQPSRTAVCVCVPCVIASRESRDTPRRGYMQARCITCNYIITSNSACMTNFARITYNCFANIYPRTYRVRLCGILRDISDA